MIENAQPYRGPLGVLLGAAAVVIVIAGLKLASPLIVPFLLAAFIATILIPPLQWLLGLRVPLPVAILLLLLGLVLVFVPLFLVAGAALDDFRIALPGYLEKIQNMTTSTTEWLRSRGIETGGEALKEIVAPSTLLSLMRQVGGGLGTALASFLLVMFTLIFILAESSGFPGKIREALGGKSELLDSFRDLSRRLQDYLRIKTLVSLMTGVFVTFCLTLIGLDFAILWGLLAFLLNYIPNIGSILAAVPPVLLAIVALDPTGVVLVISAYLAVNMIVGNILEPRMFGKGLGLSTLVVFISLVFWGWVFGPVGMLLSGPLTMALKIALETHPNTRWFAILLGPSRASDEPVKADDAPKEPD
jgi:predicted PurR-regulated permease PerM